MSGYMLQYVYVAIRGCLYDKKEAGDNNNDRNETKDNWLSDAQFNNGGFTKSREFEKVVSQIENVFTN